MQKNNKLSSNDIRKLFREFFSSKGYTYLPSFPLIPVNDSSLLFINSGMAPMKEWFLNPETARIQFPSSIQKCLRVGGKHNDLNNVGYTTRHHTFFEMCGHFAFGHYNKLDAMQVAYNFLVDVLKINKDNLSFSYFPGDLNTLALWKNITELNDKAFFACEDNLWSMGEYGPQGLCTEIFFRDGDYEPIEIWNLVFMTQNKLQNGEIENLASPCLDTGMGLERISSIVQGKKDNFENDIFTIIKSYYSNITGCKNNTALNVISDHIRAIVFLVSENVSPANENRGYILKRLIRRACNFNIKNNINLGKMQLLVPLVIETMGDYYPEIIEYSSLAAQIISEEEEKFHNSIGKNLSLIHQVISSSQGSVQGSDAFFLYDTKGVPLELLTEIALDYGLEIDLENFNKLMTQQRSQSSKKIPKILHNVMHQKSVFYGYDKNDCQGMILGIYKILELEITGNDYDETYNAVVLDNTVFYPRGGGQVGDSGFLLRNGEKIFFVYEAIKVNENIYHIGSFLQKNVNIGDCVHCEIDLTKRNAITKNHTATHLLHAAIMLLFGKNSVQRGSLVNEMKLRFDFHCESNVTKEHIMKLEDIVNTWIIEQHPCVVQHLSLDEAQKQRVILLDCASYNEEIRILKIGNPDIISQEACGGTHVSNSGMIGSFGILDCKTIAKDTRRIEAVTGWNYHKVYQNMFSITQQVRDLFKTNIENLFDKADKTIQELNEAKNYLQKYEEGLFLLQTKPENINVLIENYHNIALKYVVLNYLRAPFFKYIQQQDKNINSLLLYLLLDSKNTVKNIYWFSSHSSATSLANYLQQITSENVEIKGNMFQLNLTRKVQCNNLLDIIKQAK